MGRRVCRPARSLICRVSFPVLTLVVLCGLLIPVTGTAAPAADPVKVTQSDRTGLELTVSDLQTTWKEVSLRDGQVVLHEPSVGGFVTSGQAGGPRLPRTGGWLIVPPGTRPEVVVVQESWSSTGARPLHVQTVPVVIPGEEPGQGSTAEYLVLPGEALPQNVSIPEEVLADFHDGAKSRPAAGLTLGETGWWRGRRIVSWSLVPLRYDTGLVADGALVSGTWRIRFVPEAGKSGAIPPGHRDKTVTRGDDRFGSIFLNGDLLGSLPTEATWRGDIPAKINDGTRRGTPKLPGQLEAKLAVQQTHLYRVPFSRLDAAGYLPPGPVREDQIRLYQRRYLARLDGTDEPPWVDIEVPIHMMGEGDNFDGDDFFLFYGLRLRDDTDFLGDVGQGPETLPGAGDPFEMNNDVNYYWLAAMEPPQGESWARMAVASLPSATLTPRSNYRRDDHYEEQLAFRENVPNVYTDRVYYNQSDADQVLVGINPLKRPDPAGAAVDLRVGLAGLNSLDWPITFELVTDNTLTTHLEDLNLSTINDVVRTYSVPASAIDGQQTKLVVSINDTRAKINAFLNWVEISYDALYQAVSDELNFHGGEGTGPQAMEVTGFSSADIGLVEITDPRNPVFHVLSGGNVRQDGDDWTLSIQPDQGTEQRRFFAVEGVSGIGVVEFAYFKSLIADNQQNPLELSGDVPDMVVVTHGDFRPGLGTWLEHRRARADDDLEIHVVDVQDIFDWYSGGLRDPWAVKRFSNQVMTRWGSWAMTFVGDANENARELGVLSSGKAWSKDWVPTHYHVQKAQNYAPELLACDKWYATLQSGMNYPIEDFPDAVYLPYEMYVGRLPCNNLTELNTLVSKIQVVENVQPGQDWRKRGIFIADDAWSNGYGLDELSYFVHKPWEEDFAESEGDVLVPLWQTGTPVTLETELLLLDDYLAPIWAVDPDFSTGERNAARYKDHAEVHATPALLAAMNRGGLVCHYQGHGNIYVLSSEYWFEDRMSLGYRKDVTSLVNGNAPWVFFGMGCHIGDWAQTPYYNSIYPREQSLCEKLMVRQGGGASAAYGSSGYEYIDSNVVFGEYIFQRWMQKPPTQLLGAGAGSDHRSRWMLGELMWASEADILAVLGGSTSYRRMVAQYELLGDPLMMLDAGEPEVQAVLTGDTNEEISGTVDLVALDETSLRVINLAARDEAGISRLVVLDSLGTDLTAEVVTEDTHGAPAQQLVDYRLDMPVRPFDHFVTVDVYDTGGDLATDRHYQLKLVMSQTAGFAIGGEPVDPTEYVFPIDQPVAFESLVSTSAWIAPDAQMTLTSDNLELSNVVVQTDKSREVTLIFTAEVTDGQTRGRTVVLTIDGYASTYELQAGDAEVRPSSITGVYNFPNPMRDNTRFLFQTGAPGGNGWVRIFAVSGRAVARVPFSYAGNAEGGVIDWAGRDDDGDALSNGTYLYRIEMETTGGLIVSEMQRLVVMR